MALIATVLVAVQGVAQEPASTAFQVGETVYVTGSSLALRRGPSPDTERIHYIPKGTGLKVLPDTETPVPFEIEGLKGHWLRVKHDHHKGYVFDGFVSANVPPLEDRIDWTIVPGERVGPITYKTTYQDLVGVFGNENIEEATVYPSEGETEPGTAIFPGTSNQVTIQWADFHKKPAVIYLSSSNSRWATTRGLRIGTTLKELISLNNAPVSFAGFGWDNEGVVTGWNDGRLVADHAVHDDLSLNILPEEPYDRQAKRTLLGDRIFDSNHPAAAKLNLKVTKIIIRLHPPKVTLPDMPSYPGALAQKPPLQSDVERYVIASKLNVREAPEAGAAVIYRMPYGSKVQVAKRTGERVPLVAEGIYGHWIPLSIQGKVGYAFNAYLTPYPVPRAGTEGLWDYSEVSLTPDGAEQRTTTGDDHNGSETVKQTYKEGVTLEHKSMWQTGRTSHTTSLTLPNLSIEQAYILMKRADKRFKDLPFNASPQGRFSATVAGLTMTIEPQPDGVRITESGSK
jgi:hypothetical protein